MQKMRNYLWFLLLLGSLCLSYAKPLVSFGINYQTPTHYVNPGPGPYYNNYYGTAQSSYYTDFGGPYRYHNYNHGNRYGALDVGIGALSLTPFLL